MTPLRSSLARVGSCGAHSGWLMIGVIPSVANMRGALSAGDPSGPASGIGSATVTDPSSSAAASGGAAGWPLHAAMHGSASATTTATRSRRTIIPGRYAKDGAQETFCRSRFTVNFPSGEDALEELLAV